MFRRVLMPLKNVGKKFSTMKSGPSLGDRVIQWGPAAAIGITLGTAMLMANEDNLGIRTEHVKVLREAIEEEIKWDEQENFVDDVHLNESMQP